VCRGPRKSSQESENRVHLQSHHAQLRKKRNKSKKEPVWRSSTGASGLPRRPPERSRRRPSQVCRTWLPPQKLSSPSQSLYMDMAMVMMQKKGLPRDGAMGGSMGSTSATKSDAGVKLRVPTSSRTSLLARIVRRVTTALQPYPTLRPARPNSGTTRARLLGPPRDLPRP
jgi:hypothetical protein